MSAGERLAAERNQTPAELLTALIQSAALTSSNPATPATTAHNPVDLINEKPATPGERDPCILELHNQGVSGREIARRLGIGETTVRKVLKRDPSQ